MSWRFCTTLFIITCIELLCDLLVCIALLLWKLSSEWFLWIIWMNRRHVLLHKKMLGFHLVAVRIFFENGLFSRIDVQVILCDFENVDILRVAMPWEVIVLYSFSVFISESDFLLSHQRQSKRVIYEDSTTEYLILCLCLCVILGYLWDALLIGRIFMAWCVCSPFHNILQKTWS